MVCQLKFSKQIISTALASLLLFCSACSCRVSASVTHISLSETSMADSVTHRVRTHFIMYRTVLSMSVSVIVLY